VKDELILRKYTLALYEVAKEQGALKDVDKELRVVAQTFEKLPELNEFLTSPQVEWKQKVELSATMTKGMSKYMVNFISLVLEKERQAILPLVPDEFRRMLDRQKKRESAVVTSMVPLPDDIKKALEAKLGDLTGGEVQLESKIDEGVIGGFRVQIGHTVIDGTVKRKLEELGRLLVK
jgi:F-type H+-transporting ATPase subunit delta